MLIKKEETLFDKQKTAEENKWQRVEEKTERENIRKIYKKAISALGTFIASERQREDTSLDWEKSLPVKKQEKRDGEIQNVINRVSELILRYPSHENLKNDLDVFILSPNSHADVLQESLIQLIKNEDGFFLTKPKQISDNTSKDKDIYSIFFKIDNEFRKEQLIMSGISISTHHNISVSFKEITQSQREKIIKTYYRENSNLQKKYNFKIADFFKKRQ